MASAFPNKLRWIGILTVAVIGVLLVSNIHNLRRPGPPDRPNAGAPPAEDPLLPVAERYAPFIYHAASESRWREDIISNVDFDGDLVGNNNWENFERYHLAPTVYYAVLETETHYFISYHLFHPRDWNHFTVWLNDTHENDGENLQVVVSKSDGHVALLWTQAHYDSWVYARPDSSISRGSVRIEADMQLVGEDGVPDQRGHHAAVFVESQGHGIYGTLHRSSKVRLESDGAFAFSKGTGILYRPARTGEGVTEPAPGTREAPYRLDSITVKLWPLLRDGALTGDGRLLDGSYAYSDDFVSIPEVPRYYDADRFSGPLGSDRGISPFALDFEFRRGTLGALFFNPARRYAEVLTISEPWSTQYVDYPFVR